MNYHHYDKKACHVIKMLRTDKNLSQKTLYNKLCMGQSKYSRIEKGKKALTIGQLIEISHEIKMNATDVLKLILDENAFPLSD